MNAWSEQIRQVCPNPEHAWAPACKHTHTQIHTNLGAVPQSVVGILHQTGQETYVVAKHIEKNWEGPFLVGWELVRRKQIQNECILYINFEISEEHKIIHTKNMRGLDLKQSQLYVALKDGNQRLQKAKISRKWQHQFHD